MRTQWTGRVVTDTRGDAGAVVLDAEYALGEDSEAWVMDALTGAEITYEDREVALAEYGIAVEFNG